MNEERFPTVRRVGRWCVRVAPRVGFGLLVLFVLVAIPWTYFNIKWGLELEAKLAELKAQGLPLTLAEAAPKPVPASQNAAVLYQKVFGEFSSPGLVPERRYIGGITEEEHHFITTYIKTGRAERRQVRRILSRPAVKRDLQIIRRASQRPHCIFPVNWEGGAGALFPHFAGLRSAAQMLRIQALVSAEAGHLDEALDWCRVALRISEHAASEPTLIAQLVAIAIQAITLDALERIISGQQLEPGVANDFQEYLSRIDLRKAFTDGMIGERALGIETTEAIRRGTYGSVELPIVQTYRSRLAWPLWKLDELTYIDYMSRVVEAQRLPYARAVGEIESANKELRALPFYQGVLAKILIPVFARVVHKRAMATANIGLCRVVLALKAYRYEHGAYPETLDQLQQALDWELPQDPFSGKDFIYQRTGGGFRLCSIGRYREDDGSVPPTDSPQKLSCDDADIVWQCRR